MTIKEASEITGVSVDNLRYYERIGLIPQVPRNASGFRDYDDVSLRWIKFILCFKRCGMTLEEIANYVKLSLEGNKTQPARRQLLIEARKRLMERMEEIKESLNMIDHKLEVCDKKDGVVTEAMVEAWR